MAVFGFRAKVFNKYQHNVIAAAAYRAGESLIDNKQIDRNSLSNNQPLRNEFGKKFDYTTKKFVYNSFIMLPKNAPEFLADRQTLWTEVQNIESRYDARVAREFQVDFPIELKDYPELMEEMIKLFVENNLVSQGLIADVAMHKIIHDYPKSYNPHAHILINLRELKDQTKLEEYNYRNGKNGKVFKRPDYEVNSPFYNKNRLIDKKEFLLGLRENWASVCNQYLEKIGSAERVDHRSYADRANDPNLSQEERDLALILNENKAKRIAHKNYKKPEKFRHQSVGLELNNRGKNREFKREVSKLKHAVLGKKEEKSLMFYLQDIYSNKVLSVVDSEDNKFTDTYNKVLRSYHLLEYKNIHHRPRFSIKNNKIEFFLDGKKAFMATPDRVVVNKSIPNAIDSAFLYIMNGGAKKIRIAENSSIEFKDKFLELALLNGLEIVNYDNPSVRHAVSIKLKKSGEVSGKDSNSINKSVVDNSDNDKAEVKTEKDIDVKGSGSYKSMVENTLSEPNSLSTSKNTIRKERESGFVHLDKADT
ncbi:MAG: MobA/MobL family protein [Gammaproteobacteria bacterium]|nr:MobA/MobL family protein [Gammaproteobacteria bacterium]